MNFFMKSMKNGMKISPQGQEKSLSSRRKHQRTLRQINKDYSSEKGKNIKKKWTETHRSVGHHHTYIGSTSAWEKKERARKKHWNK